MTNLEMQQILTASEITISEVSALFHITRPTVHRWLKGTKPKQQVAYLTIASYFARLQAAVDRGDLPLSKDIKRSARKDVIRELLRR